MGAHTFVGGVQRACGHPEDPPPDGRAGSTLTVTILGHPLVPILPGGSSDGAADPVALTTRGGRTLRFTNGAHRASTLFGGARALILAVALLGLAGLVAAPAASAATPTKVVIVVGPTGTGTAHNISEAKQLAAQARGYGATVIEIYSPNASFYRVRSAAMGANVFIYMGHGSGWPSPYSPFNAARKDGLGLNATAGHGNLNVRYYGETYLKKYIHLAANSVVILRGLCYSAGNSEPGKTNPSAAVGRARVDNYAAGFLRTGARVVFAEPYGGVGYILDAIFTTNLTVRQIFTNGAGAGHWGHSSAGTMTATAFKSKRTTWATAISDRDSSGHFRRSVVGNLALTASAIR